jgi:hypothetical protein
MRLLNPIAAAVLALSTLSSAGPADRDLLSKQGFVPLFNGKDFTGWKSVASTNHWAIEKGMLVLKDRTDGKMRNAEYLWTEDTFGDFIVDLEFRVPEGPANSGVFLRTADLNDPVQTGIEIQVGNAVQGKPLTKSSVGGIYNLVAPRQNAFKPGEWNRYTITCKGSKVSVLLNGTLVSEADLDRWTKAHLNPDGTRNKFNRPLKDFARRGHIGLQDHGRPVSYRNIWIKRLD